MGQVLLGLGGKMYFGSPGTTPTQAAENEVLNARDVNMNLEWSMANTTRRGSKRQKTSKPTIRSITIELDLINVPTDSDVATLQAAAVAGTAVAILALDQDSGEGPDGDFYVASWQRAEPIEGEEAFSVTLEPTDEYRTLDWYESSSSSS